MLGMLHMSANVTYILLCLIIFDDNNNKSNVVKHP
jgi:hypothetical protein